MTRLGTSGRLGSVQSGADVTKREADKWEPCFLKARIIDETSFKCDLSACDPEGTVY